MEVITKTETIEENGVKYEVTLQEVERVALTVENQVSEYLTETLAPFGVDETTIEDIVVHLKDNELLA